MDFLEKMLKEVSARMAIASIVEPIKQRLSEIGITLEYKVTNIDIERAVKLAEQHQENIENGDDVKESLDKIFGHKTGTAHNKDNISSDELIKYFIDKESGNETAKTDN